MTRFERLRKVIVDIISTSNNPEMAADDIMLLIKKELKNEEIPSWLSDEDYQHAVELYKNKKLDAVKFLTEIARPYSDTPLKWSHEFLNKHTTL